MPSSVFREYLGHSSFHGLHFLVDADLHWTERLFWLVCVTASWAGSVYLMLTTLELAYETPTTLYVDTDYLYWNTTFPAIVVCETNNDRILEAAQRLYKDNSEVSTKQLFNLQQIVFFENAISEETIYRYVGNMSFYKTLRSPCSDIFNYCSWDNKEFDCCEQFLPVETPYGTCFAVNSKQTNQTKSKIKMFMGRKPGHLVTEYKNPNLMIFAISNEELPILGNIPIVKNSQFEQRNYHVYLSVKETQSDPEVREVDVARRKCRFPDENNLKVSTAYSMEACKLQHEKAAQLAFYNCTQIYMPYAHPSELCDDVRLVDLVIGTLEWSSEAQSHFNCELSCTENYVIVHLSTSDLKTATSTQHWKKSSSQAHVHIQCEPSYSKLIRMKTSNMLDNIVSLGGTAGLFVGASILSLLEFVYYLTIRAVNTKIMRIKVSRKKRRNTSSVHVFPFVN